MSPLLWYILIGSFVVQIFIYVAFNTELIERADKYSERSKELSQQLRDALTRLDFIHWSAPYILMFMLWPMAGFVLAGAIVFATWNSLLSWGRG